MENKEHKARHINLHSELDELRVNYVTQTRRYLLSITPMMEYMSKPEIHSELIAIEEQKKS